MCKVAYRLLVFAVVCDYDNVKLNFRLVSYEIRIFAFVVPENLLKTST
jgi:hypothetical protein